MEFNRQINGLRALAVAVVVLFHLSVPGFRGGFVGVDIFFVISGYLMTSILLRRMSAGRLSVWRFYGDRARRIVPALLVLCAVMLACGWFWLLPSDYRKLGKQVGGSLAFVSNLLYWREAGYFADSSHRNWLLHTWSLSVEWQFYLAYPVLLLLLRRAFGMRGLGWALLVVAAGSFATSVLQSAYAPGAAFFLLPSRAWELLLGAFVYLLPLRLRPTQSRIAEAGGMLLVVASVAVLGPADPWPGWAALAPTLGTALVIASRRPRSLWMDAKPVQWLGKISYSVYLWHWPLVVAATHFIDLDAPVRVILVVTLSLVLGALSFRLVESPIRRTQGAGTTGSRTRARAAGLATLLVMAAAGGAAAWATNGAPWRFAQAVQLADLEALNNNPRSKECFATSGPPVPACVFGAPDKPVVVELLGDSHALSLASALVTAAPGAAGPVRFRGYASCPTIEGASYGRSDNRCEDFVRDALATLNRESGTLPPLVITNYWNDYIETGRVRFVRANAEGGNSEPFSIERFHRALLDTVCPLAQRRRVYLTLPLPRFDFDVPRVMAYRLMRDPGSPAPTLDVAEHRRKSAAVQAMMEDARDRCGVHLLDPTPYLCPKDRCLASLDGRPLYFDEHHLSEFGNRLLLPMFGEVFAAK